MSMHKISDPFQIYKYDGMQLCDMFHILDNVNLCVKSANLHYKL
jgi:hypothetical protein